MPEDYESFGKEESTLEDRFSFYKTLRLPGAIALLYLLTILGPKFGLMNPRIAGLLMETYTVAPIALFFGENFFQKNIGILKNMSFIFLTSYVIFMFKNHTLLLSNFIGINWAFIMTAVTGLVVIFIYYLSYSFVHKFLGIFTKEEPSRKVKILSSFFIAFGVSLFYIFLLNKINIFDMEGFTGFVKNQLVKGAKNA